MSALDENLRCLKALVLRLEVRDNKIEVGWVPSPAAGGATPPDPLPTRSCDPNLKVKDVRGELLRLLNVVFPTT